MSIEKPRVLLTNDDGPPGPDSPYIYGLYLHLTRELGWEVKVVVPSSQKSWIGKAYQIHDTIRGRYYYPKDPNGHGEVSEVSRPLKEGEVAEWVLLDGTPATCTNIGLHNLYYGEIDLLLSGPNFGRNTSAAFVLSSGTIGAALSASLSGTRAIALSYGTVKHRPPTEWHAPAHNLGLRIIQRLWKNWGADMDGLREGKVDLYNVNIPMVEALATAEGLPVLWTRIWRNTYGRLFKADTLDAKPSPDVPAAGPGVSVTTEGGGREKVSKQEISRLVFKFSPDMSGLIGSGPDALPEGSDGWAIEKGWASVTPLRASFAEPEAGDVFLDGATIEDRFMKLKL
ncbi:sure-like protein [Vararia minispora EC-137]|uniref:Sure-like protein n=1 Tax=Vararia minispora EC-137 TaxID=1314806 RepID=A0ACB8QMP8_9AGAM|nr:sure-like protein [Vararia minispora EC-137]